MVIFIIFDSWVLSMDVWLNQCWLNESVLSQCVGNAFHHVSIFLSLPIVPTFWVWKHRMASWILQDGFSLVWGQVEAGGLEWSQEEGYLKTLWKIISVPLSSRSLLLSETWAPLMVSPLGRVDSILFILIFSVSSESFRTALTIVSL